MKRIAEWLWSYRYWPVIALTWAGMVATTAMLALHADD